MGIRKNQSTLTTDEKSRFVNAVLQLKTNGVYDRYVRQHRDLFFDADAGIHRSALFLPWHREFLRRLELDLQAIDPLVTLPYWDWTVDRTLSASLWGSDFMGGNGVPAGGAVQTGAFAFSNGRWPLTVRDNPAGRVELTRAIGSGENLPSAGDVQGILTRTPFSIFTRDLEINIHNIVHGFIGGSAGDRSSPNDPAFFLLHCNVDRLWAIWQGLHPAESPFQGDARFNLNSPMQPWQNEISPPTPARVINHIALGYSYLDPGPPQITDLTVGAPPRQESISQAGEVDWYRFISPAASTYTIETQGATDVFMSLYGPNNQTTLVTEDDDSGQDSNSRIVSNLSAGTYFVRIRHFQASGTGNYGISVSGAAQPNLTEIVVNGPEIQGNIVAANESDVYIFNATQIATYTIATTGNTDTFVSLNGPNNQNSFISQDDDSGPGQNSQIVRALTLGMYYVRVRHYSPTGTGAYGVSVKRT
ncbi:tyrosinase family protein [Methyloglobulus sp.]|uniref:tyrosinase family protein n=1 Tax=Methyloglobulus sp. TaxID=2518622 RepID=UPI003988E618